MRRSDINQTQKKFSRINNIAQKVMKANEKKLSFQKHVYKVQLDKSERNPSCVSVEWEK